LKFCQRANIAAEFPEMHLQGKNILSVTEDDVAAFSQGRGCRNTSASPARRQHGCCPRLEFRMVAALHILRSEGSQGSSHEGAAGDVP